MPNYKFVPAMMPNFVTAYIAKQEVKIPIGDLDENEAKEYAELCKNSVLEHWKKKKEQSKPGGGNG